MAKICYRCGAPARSREHFPAKSFFPRGANLRLETVPACDLHNSSRSADDQYLLAHIVMNASRQDNLAQKIFYRSILPQLRQSKGFGSLLVGGSWNLPDGARAYLVDTARFDRVFDDLCHAIYFHRYGIMLDAGKHRLQHVYLSLHSQDKEHQAHVSFAGQTFARLMQEYSFMVDHYEADRIDEKIYERKVMDPGGSDASITIAHTFYGVFNVLSLLTRYVAQDPE